MSRAARAVINLDALRHNLQRASAVNPHAKQFPVIKADAYGHGLLPVSQALAEFADGFAVASIEEALKLREVGIDNPILLLEGFFDADELTDIQQFKLDIVVHHAAQLDALESLARQQDISKPIKVWLKVDTGMHRLGFAIDDIADAWQRLSRCELVNQPPRLMTHLACADDLHNPATQQQIELFNGLLPEAITERSIANSAAILGWVASHADIDRPGIMLYGASPFLDETGAARRLRPVMTLRSEVIAIKQCQAGDAVGYGATWTCPEDMSVGVVAMGYGDGYPRHAPAGTPVLINGTEVPLVGRVSMDMLCVDLRGQPNVKVGDEVVLCGEGLPAEIVARSAGAIAYELFCGVTARVTHDYIDGEN